jgi:hypothetical protein
LIQIETEAKGECQAVRDRIMLNQFWKEVHQGRVTCRLYQERYDKSKGLGMADHCLKFAVLAKSLRPPTPQTGLLAALCYHYEAYIQRVWLTAQIRTVSDAITFLKQMEDIG